MSQKVYTSDIQFRLDGITIQVGQISIGTITSTIPLHSHGSSCYECHYIMDGYGTVLSDGSEHSLTPNTLYTTGPNIEHAQYSHETSPMKECCLYLIIQGKSKNEAIERFLNTHNWIGTDTEGISTILENIITELNEKKIGYKQQIQFLISQFIIKMARSYMINKKETSKKTEDIHNNRSTVTIEHYFLYEYKELTLTTLAKKLNLSTRQTQRLLRTYYNKTFQEKKIDAKMAVANLLLKEGTQSIQNISEELGFSSGEHFSMAYKKYYGISPSQYKKQNTN